MPLFSLPLYDDNARVGIATKLTPPLEQPTRILGCANGLVCVQSYDDNNTSLFALWNLASQKLRKIPAPPGPDTDKPINFHYGFGYDSVNNDYKLVQIVQVMSNATMLYLSLDQLQDDKDEEDEEDEVEQVLVGGKRIKTRVIIESSYVDVYSLKFNLWKRIKNMNDDRFEIDSKGVYCSGNSKTLCLGDRLCWKQVDVYHQSKIITLDLTRVLTFDQKEEDNRDGAFTNVSMPKWGSVYDDYSVSSLRGNLSICNRLGNGLRYDVRILRWHNYNHEYGSGVKYSWNFLVSVDMSIVPMDIDNITPLVLSKNGNMLLLKTEEDDDHFWWFDVKKKTIKQVKIVPTGLRLKFEEATILEGVGREGLSHLLVHGDPIHK